MKNLAREFLERLDQEERTFSDQLQGDELGVMFFTAIKEFDFYYYNLMRHEASEEA